LFASRRPCYHRPGKEKIMGGIGSMWHWIIVAVVVLLLFGRGRISETMGDFGKGIRSFKKGLGDEENRPAAPPAPPAQIAAAPPPSPAPEQAASAPAATETPSTSD
jgi:sec-independent protein translocase protein TatA